MAEARTSRRARADDSDDGVVPRAHERARGSRRDYEFNLVPTEYEKRSCAGMQPRLRAMRIQRARENPAVEIGDRMSAAAEANDAEKVKSLLEQGANPNHVHFAVNSSVPLIRTSSAEVAKVLLEHPKIDVNWSDINHTTVLENVLLHRKDNVELLSVVLSHEQLDVRKGHPLRVAVRFQTARVVKRFLEHPGVDVNDPENAALHHALSRTDEECLEVVKLLVQQPDIDINLSSADTGATPLHNLSMRGSLVVEIGQKEKYLLEQAAARQVEMSKWLLARSELDASRADARGATALHKASELGRADIVRAFLGDGRFEASAWLRDGEGRTPLERAACELERPRERWNPLPCTADHRAVIKLLSEFQRARLHEVPPPRPLQRTPGAWGMLLRYVM